MKKKYLCLIILVWLCAVCAPLLIGMGRCGSFEGCCERDRLGVLGRGPHLAWEMLLPHLLLSPCPQRGAKPSLLSRFGDAEAQLLENLTVAARL